jgi:hypothetical protein
MQECATARGKSSEKESVCKDILAIWNKLFMKTAVFIVTAMKTSTLTN